MSNIYSVYYIIFYSISVLFKMAKKTPTNYPKPRKTIEYVSENQESQNPRPHSAASKLQDLEGSLRPPGPVSHL